ncbi:MAG: hypothetical protein CSA95_04355 [Bacteroidetes bacterium]|nr:MAG: hypothetical protein CSA95_04355 [Bacteroidota bacterium]
MDFTINAYRELLFVLKNKGYEFITFQEYCKNTVYDKVIILRHDVDLLPYNSLRFAQIQAEFGVKGSYYFRAVPESWDEAVIKDIAKLGHEVGYHYENMDTARGDVQAAKQDFEHNLEALRQLVDVQTICMHGSPRSSYDNKDLWKDNSYRDYGIMGEPYFDMDFDDFFYLTDTGRRWDGWRVSVRDKVSQQAQWNEKGWVYHRTFDIINAAQNEILPLRIMFTFHPQRWHANSLPWLKELVLQNVKNAVKYFVVK